MAAPFSNSFIVLILMLGSSSLFATGQPDSKSISEDSIMSLALSKFIDAENKVNEIIEVCKAREKNVVLHPSLFASLDISKRHLEIALFFLNKKAIDTCEGDYMARFYVAASRYRTAAKRAKREGKEVSMYTEDMLYGGSWGDFRVELMYNAIDEENRKVLERIPKLKKPFNLFKTFDALDIRSK